MTRRLGLIAVACLAGVLYQQPVDVPRASQAPHVGDSCMMVRYYPVHVVHEQSGVRAVFAFADGAAVGRLPLSDDDASKIEQRPAYIADAQFGTYELVDSAKLDSPVCQLQPTFHFYCPDNDAMDQICITSPGTMARTEPVESGERSSCRSRWRRR